MARIPFGLLDEPETRQPSKVRLAFFALFLLLLSLSVIFITLYALEKSKSKDSSDNRSQQTDNKVKTTNLPFKKIKPTHLSFKKVKTTHLPFEKTRTTSENIKTSNSPTAEIKTTEHLPTCTSSACLTSAGKFTGFLYIASIFTPYKTFRYDFTVKWKMLCKKSLSLGLFLER